MQLSCQSFVTITTKSGTFCVCVHVNQNGYYSGNTYRTALLYLLLDQLHVLEHMRKTGTHMQL